MVITKYGHDNDEFGVNYFAIKPKQEYTYVNGIREKINHSFFIQARYCQDVTC